MFTKYQQTRNEPRALHWPENDNRINSRPWLTRREVWEMLDAQRISVRQLGRILGSRRKAQALADRSRLGNEVVQVPPSLRSEIVKSAGL